MLLSEIRWINEPPIVEIHDRQKAAALCAQFSARFQEPTGRFPETDGTWKKEEWPEAPGSVRWNERIDAGARVATYAHFALGEHGNRFFAYLLRGELFGLMVLAFDAREGKHPFIEWLATHPGTAGGGGILVEYAVNLSEETGGEGCLELTPMSEVSRPAWTALGFVERGQRNPTMFLSPEKSAKWVKLEGRWHLVKYQGKKGFAGPA